MRSDNKSTSSPQRRPAYDRKTLSKWDPTKDPQLYDNYLGSAGFLVGGAITDNLDGTVDVAAGIGFFRISDDPTALMRLLPWPAVTNETIDVDTTRCVGVEYNAGSPQVTIRTSEGFDGNTDWPMFEIVNEDGTLHIAEHKQHSSDIPQRLAEYLETTYHIQRADNLGGLILGETGTRNPTMTLGQLSNKLHFFPIAALDLSDADTMDRYYRDGTGGWIKEAGEQQWPNEDYDNDQTPGEGGLVEMTAQRWSALYFYVETDGQLVMLYGQAQYTTEAFAELDSPPSSVPDRLATHGLLIGRMIFQKGAATATIEIAFGVIFQPGSGFLQNVVEDPTPQLGGELDCQANSIGFTQQTATGDGTTTIDWRLGNKFRFTFGAQNDVLTFTDPSGSTHLTLKIVQDGVGGRTITWPANVEWPGSSEPVLSTAAGAKDIIVFYYDADADEYHGAALFNYG